MKRYGHAWIALRAIDRLDNYAEEARRKHLAKNEPMKAQGKYDSIMYLQTLLRSRAKLVLEGAWIPDNIIADNLQGGHTWKYKPLIKKGKDVPSFRDPSEIIGVYVKEDDEYYTKKHYTTSSLCYQEAKSTDTWGKPFRKYSGRIVDRCETLRQTIRDQFLFQQNEMHKLAGTLLIKYGDKLGQDPENVREFLEDPVAVKVFYDMKYPNGDYVYRDEIISKRNKFRNSKKVRAEFDQCIEMYGEEIKAYIAELNGLRFINNKPSFFPLYFTDEQITLNFFTLSHYVADAHMPLHCDIRDFGDTKCGNIHELMEEVWDYWVIEEDEADALVKVLSETERSNRFLKKIFKGDDPTWMKFVYPDNSLLAKLDKMMGRQLWDEREAKFYSSVNIWKQIVGVSYASYCLSSRLFPFNDNIRIIPEGDKLDYSSGGSVHVKLIKGKNWKKEASAENMKLPDSYDSTKLSNLNNFRRGLYDVATAFSNEDIVFNYLSLLVLVDSVESVAKVWARSVGEYFDLRYSQN